MKKINYFLFLPLMFVLILVISCDREDESKEIEQLTTRKISSSLLGLNVAKELNEKLYNAVMEGKIKAYRYDSITATCMFTTEEIKSLSTLEESIQYAPDSSRPDFLIDTVLKQSFTANEIIGYSIAEKWSIEPDENEIEGDIFAFAVNWQPKIAGIQIPESALFWVDYNDVVKLLSKEQAMELKKTIFNSLVLKISEF
jgi:hypothetical protein